MEQIKSLLFLPLFCLLSCFVNAQKLNSGVKVVGQMRDVMWKGLLYDNIQLDTISNRLHLYGLGPMEFLAGEIMVLDGMFYKSFVLSDTSMGVEEAYDIKAPFFSYANISEWIGQDLPDTILSIQQLELYLDGVTRNSWRPFMFRLTGQVEKATIHIVNLPKGTKVSSPDDAHKGQKNYQVQNEQVDNIGFFSTSHKAIFTHHDTFLHMHLMTTDKKKMGHLDHVLFKKGSMKLHLPVD